MACVLGFFEVACVLGFIVGGGLGFSTSAGSAIVKSNAFQLSCVDDTLQIARLEHFDC